MALRKNKRAGRKAPAVQPDRGPRAADDLGGFICPYCRAELTWDKLCTLETEVTIYVREKIYYCPGCRAFLGVSSWHTEG